MNCKFTQSLLSSLGQGVSAGAYNLDVLVIRVIISMNGFIDIQEWRCFIDHLQGNRKQNLWGVPGCELPLLTFTCPGAKSMNNKQVCNFRSGKRHTGPFSFYQWITNMVNRSNDDLFSFILSLFLPTKNQNLVYKNVLEKTAAQKVALKGTRNNLKQIINLIWNNQQITAT